MKVHKLYLYYAFGFNYRMLTDGYRGHENETAIEGIESFLENIDKFDLKVTKLVVSDFLDKFSNDLKKSPKSEKLSDNKVSELMEFARSIDKTVDAEMRLKKAYILTEKRLGLEKLTDNVEELFGDKIFPELPEICKIDFIEAGKCISFERHTAAAFHILRGTEEMLRVYYKEKVKRNRIKKLLWHNMTQDLQGKRGVPDSLLAVLDSIREDFRNPTAHPEKLYDFDEVQTLFTHSIDVIGRLVKGMKK